MAKSKANKPARKEAVVRKPAKRANANPVANNKRLIAKHKKPFAKTKSKKVAKTKGPARRAAPKKKRSPAKAKSRAAASKQRRPAKAMSKGVANSTRSPGTAKVKSSTGKKPANRSRATNRARPPAPLQASAAPPIDVPDWRSAVRAEVAKTGDDFAAFLRSLAATGWEHADSPELAGLEQWGTELARRDRSAGIGALVRVAQYGFPIAVAAGGIGLEGMGFHAAELSVDGAPVETQIELAARWLDAPDAAQLAAVAAGNDRSRQLQMWDDDLRPSDDRAHWWYLDVGQCCGHAITQRGGDPNKHSYYDWPPETCVGRGLVVAVRGLRSHRADLRAILGDVRAALIA